ncbi:MAG: BrnT family toxin [Gemmatimonadetes bacterium]|nr:BrnT family toxin [Gemmatimonadota bacterium]MYH54106.1 BrnT family toxin [Gemmatimonadota bacterium]MYK65957.1 BrnT family toxin [Gemmatimonadota bacterium]
MRDQFVIAHTRRGRNNRIISMRKANSREQSCSPYSV